MITRNYLTLSLYLEALEVDSKRWTPRKALRADAYDVDTRDLPRGV